MPQLCCRGVQHGMHIFWETLEYMANSVVFFYFGVLIAVRIYVGHQSGSPSEADGEEAPAMAAAAEEIAAGEVVQAEEQLLEGRDWGYAVLNWVLLNVIRFVVIAIFKPFLERVGDGFSWQDTFLATWAGLRGAVGLSLALIVDLAQQQPDASPNLDGRYAPTQALAPDL